MNRFEKCITLFKASKARLESCNIPFAKCECYPREDSNNYWGMCQRSRSGFDLYISAVLLESGTDEEIMNTICHELIHTIPGCFNHGETFKKYAKILNESFNMKIARSNNHFNNAKIVESMEKKAKYKK